MPQRFIYTENRDGTPRRIVREYLLLRPPAWQYWLNRVYERNSRLGLPLVVVLHGGGQDAEAFARSWAFAQNWQTRDPDDQFFVLYPYGFGFDAPRDPPDYIPFERSAVWNPGNFVNTNEDRDDVGFILALIDHLDLELGRAAWPDGASADPRPSARLGRAFDPRRKFLFGYSAGGMTRYRLLANSRDFAAAWILAGTIGGRGFTDASVGQLDPILNDPRLLGPGYRLSLVHHHGMLDENVTPGDVGQTWLQPSQFDIDGLVRSGLSNSNAVRYSRQSQSLETAMSIWVEQDGLDGPTVTSNLPQVVTPPSQVLPESTLRRWNEQGIQPGRGPEDLEIFEYRDPTMDHTNFLGDNDPATRSYYGTERVWAFFKTHRKV